MAKRTYRPNTEEADTFTYDTRLPVHLPVANYYRQSTMEQVGNQSTALQTVDMSKYLERLGWPEEKIIMIDMDAGISGTKKIDERPGMSELFRLITAGEVGAVSCQDEDRLFRDVTQIQVNIFIEACRANRVLVITPSMIYNFAHEYMGTLHARQFRWKSEVAAEYISSYIRGKLYHAKQRLMQQGRWTGAPITPGYMVDERKMLPGGSPNENWRKFAIFEPYAEVAREYWNLFLAFGGHIRKTARHIREHGPYFPDPEQCPPPEGFRTAYRIHAHQGKRCIGKTGLRYMLTNAMYAGHWVVDNRIVIRDNHPAIIEPEMFMLAFNYLSDVTLEGLPNPDYRPNYVHARPSLDEIRPEERPLCLGLMVAEDEDGSWLPVGSVWDGKLGYFNYLHVSRSKDVPLWRKRASYIDEAVTGLMLKNLKETFDFENWKAELDLYAGDFRRQRQGMEAQVEQLKKVMDNLLMSLGTLTHPQMIAAAQKQYSEAEQEHIRLLRELSTSREEQLRVEHMERIRDSCERVADNWPNMGADERRQVVHMFTAQIKATIVDRQAIHLHIFWQDGSKDEVTLAKQTGNGQYWSTEELDRLVERMLSGADPLSVSAEFPNRSWESIRRQYRQHSRAMGKYVLIVFPRPLPIGNTECYDDYLARTGQKSAGTLSSDDCSAALPRRSQF